MRAYSPLANQLYQVCPGSSQFYSAGRLHSCLERVGRRCKAQPWCSRGRRCRLESCNWWSVGVVTELCTLLGHCIPASGNIICERWSRANFSSQSQITKFYDIIVDKQVLGLHITMKEAILMHAGESTGNLVDDISALIQFYLISFSVNFFPSSFILE